MSEDDYLRCECKECRNFIEFPPAIAGTTIECPLCKQWTELLVEPADEEATDSKTGLLLGIGCVILLLLVIGGFIGWFQHRKSTAATDTLPVMAAKNDPKPASEPSKAAIMAMANTNVIAATLKTNAHSPAKSLADFESGDIRLEKTKGSSLIYAVGNLTNDSDFQRFGVKVQLELSNAKGKNLGPAQDYKDVMEPHGVWQFHAMVLDAKTTTAKVVSVKEDN